MTNFQNTAMGNLASLGSIAALQAQGIASLAQANLASAHLAATNSYPSASMAGGGALGGNGNVMGYGFGFGLGGITGLGLGASSLSGARGGLEGLSLGPFSPGGRNDPKIPAEPVPCDGAFAAEGTNYIYDEGGAGDEER